MTYHQLNFQQKGFLRSYCYPPPGIEISDTDHTLVSEVNPLRLFKNYFGNDFVQSVRDKVVLDVGCGQGDQVIGLAKEGAKYVIGVDIRSIFENARIRVEHLGLSHKVKFMDSPLRELEKESIDLAISRNSIEHIVETEKMFNDVFFVLKSKGKFFVTFGPPWLHPYGVHMFMMIKYPWAHILFSEKTIMTVRKLYRNDNANKFEEIEGGLSKMTIKKFKRHIQLSGFKLDKLILSPVRGLFPLIKIPFIREFFTTHVSAILIKP